MDFGAPFREHILHFLKVEDFSLPLIQSCQRCLINGGEKVAAILKKTFHFLKHTIKFVYVSMSIPKFKIFENFLRSPLF